MERRHLVGLPMAVLILTAACHPPTAPESRASQDVHVRGQVLAYTEPSKFSAISGADLVGWVETDGGGRPTGRIPLDENGRFDLVVERGARVRLYAGGWSGNEIYQPCAVTIIAAGDVNRDVRLVGDNRLLGTAVPPAFLEHTRILSGAVYETIPGVGRRPASATVTAGGYREWNGELGWPIANTRTDWDGRYIICGLESDLTATVYAYNMNLIKLDVTESVVRLFHGDTVLDIDLKAAIAASARLLVLPRPGPPSWRAIGPRRGL